MIRAIHLPLHTHALPWFGQWMRLGCLFPTPSLRGREWTEALLWQLSPWLLVNTPSPCPWGPRVVTLPAVVSPGVLHLPWFSSGPPTPPSWPLHYSSQWPHGACHLRLPGPQLIWDSASILWAFLIPTSLPQPSWVALLLPLLYSWGPWESWWVDTSN